MSVFDKKVFMALLTILEYPDPRLTRVAKTISVFDETLWQLEQDMIETMKNADGIGLAATQVGVLKRMVILDIPALQKIMTLVNPVLLEAWGEVEREEGCLSVPGIFDRVVRAERIRFRAQDVQGNVWEEVADGILATCILHEMDHLEGKVFVDYLSPMKQNRIKTKMRKRHRQNG